MSLNDRLLAAYRTKFFLRIWKEHVAKMSKRFPDLYKASRSFISSQSFNIFNRLCDSLILLALAYARFYPEHPFCPWLLGTEFVEHFFGLARTLLPDFTYAELLKLVKHIMLRQHILLTGSIKYKKERNSRSGYILDYDPTPLTPAQLQQTRVVISNELMNHIVELAHDEATAICKQLLGMASPPLPWVHVPLQAPTARRQRSKPIVTDEAEGDEDEAEDEDEDEVEPVEADDEENEAQPEPDQQPQSHDGSALPNDVADAALYTARYSALSEDYEATLSELPAEADEGTSPLEAPAELQVSASASQIGRAHV